MIMAGFLSKIGKAIGSVASPLVSGAFGIGSALLGNKSQSDTNKANMQIAQMNNEWSEKMMEKQRMYDLQDQEYNSASNQRKRLEEAGMNPSLMMSGGSAGTAHGSSVGLPSPTTPNIQPMRYDGFANAINNSIQQMMMINKTNADINNQNKSTDAQVAEARAKIALMAQQERNQKFQNELNDITKDLQISHMNEDWLRKVQERSNMEEQQKLIKQQITAQRLINENLPEKLAMEVAVMASTRDLNKHNAQSEVGKVIDTLKKKGYKLSESEEKRIFEAVIGDIYNEQWRGVSPWQTAVSSSHELGKKIDNFFK